MTFSDQQSVSAMVGKYPNLYGSINENETVFMARTIAKNEVFANLPNYNQATGSFSLLSEKLFTAAIPVETHLDGGLLDRNKVFTVKGEQAFNVASVPGIVVNKDGSISATPYRNLSGSVYVDNYGLVGGLGTTSTGISVGKDGRLSLRIADHMLYPESAAKKKVKIKYSLSERLCNMHPSLKISYEGAIHVLNLEGPDFIRHMVLSLRQIFDYFVKVLPDKDDLLIWIAGRKDYLIFDKCQGKVLDTRPTSKATYLYLTRHQTDYPSGDEFYGIFHILSPALHCFNPVYTTFQEALDILERCEEMIGLVLDAHEALNN